MNKVYLLLRNNQQTGPHSLEELLQFDLKQNDLIWVEGRSCGWSYPYEVDALKPHVPQPAIEPTSTVNKQPIEEPAHHQYMPQNAQQSYVPNPIVSDKIYVRLPGGTAPVAQPEEPTSEQLLEQKAEALRRRAQAFSSGQTLAPETPIIENRYTRPLEDVEEEYTAWVYQQKTAKKKKGKQKSRVLITALVILLAVGYYFMQNGVTSNNSATDQTTTALVSNRIPDLEAENTFVQEPGNNTIFTAAEIAAPVTTIAKSGKQQTQKGVISFKAKPTNAAPVTESKHHSVSSVPTLQTPANESTADANNTSIAENNTQEKKKTIGQKIDGFFEKLKTKKQEEEAAARQPAPGSTEGERNAEQRSDEAAEPVNLISFIDISTNQNAENWMIGIQNLKLTLRNRGNQTVSSAVVSVQYYNEQNDLLETKTVQVNNIPAKRSVTVAAPGHRLADHIDYQLVSAVGSPNE